MRIALLFTTIFLLSFFSQTTHADWWDRFQPPLKLEFDKVAENPKAFLNVVVKFTVRFNEVGDYHPPAYTQFSESQYINFAVWPLERKLWVKEDYLNDYKFLYMRKINKEFQTLLKLRKYDTITILGKVRSTFNGRAWIDIVKIDKERGFLSKKLISALILAHRQVENQDYQAAIDTFRYLLDYNIPVDIRGYCLKMLGRIYYEIDDIIPAAYEFRKALKILRYDLELQKWYKECYKIIIREGLKEEYELYKGTPRRIRDDYPESQDPIQKSEMPTTYDSTPSFSSGSSTTTKQHTVQTSTDTYEYTGDYSEGGNSGDTSGFDSGFESTGGGDNMGGDDMGGEDMGSDTSSFGDDDDDMSGGDDMGGDDMGGDDMGGDDDDDFGGDDDDDMGGDDDDDMGSEEW